MEPSQIRLTDSLIREWTQQEKERGRKPTAGDTPFRYSGAGDCSRYLAYVATDPQEESTMDAGGVWVTGLGTRIHEWLQDSLSRRFPSATFETATKLSGLISGHCDAVIPEGNMIKVFPDWDGGNVLYELKTMGATKFDKQIGLKRRARKVENPEGPAVSAIIQSGLNAMANDCQTVIIGSIALECVSQGIAGDIGFTDYERFIAEWTIPEDVWRPAAEAELRRVENIATSIGQGFLPDREFVSHVDGDTTHINIDRYWKCGGYCEYSDRCFIDGDGIVPMPES